MLADLQQEAVEQPTLSEPMSVEIITVVSESVTLNIHTRGTTQPATESTLSAASGGLIVEMDKRLNSGGLFKKGELLLRFDEHPYRSAVARAKMTLAEAELNLAQRHALAKQARREIKRAQREISTPLGRHEPQMHEARSRVESAQAELEEARFKLAQTRVTAPFDGMVSSRLVRLAQDVSEGTPLVDFIALERAEIRLPISAGELYKLGFSWWQKPESGSRPKVWLSGKIGGKHHQWLGALVRSEGTINRDNQMIYLVAEVLDPYGLTNNRHSPLPMGQMVDAVIEGVSVNQAWAVPRHALYNDKGLLIVDEKNQLHHRSVNIVDSTNSRLVIDKGLADGDRVVIISKVNYFIDGLTVNPTPTQQNTTASTGHE